jgi:hypothetical protein
MDPLSLNHSGISSNGSGNGNEGSSSAAAAGSGQTASTLQSLNTSADLLLRLSAYNLHQIQQQQQQQQQQPQQVPPQQAQPHHTQFQLVSQPVQQQPPYFPFTFTPNSMAVMSNSGTATPPNTGSVRPSTFSDRERQIKRRTKTGMSVFGKV